MNPLPLVALLDSPFSIFFDNIHNEGRKINCAFRLFSVEYNYEVYQKGM
jgi:hypothetical protein